MSFIRPRNTRLVERSANLRVELLGFLLSVTLWGVMVGVIGNTAFTLVQTAVQGLMASQPWVVVVLALIMLAVFLHGILMIVAHTVAASMTEVRRFTIVLPLLYRDRGMEVLAMDGYRTPGDVKKHLARAMPPEWEEDVSQAVRENPGRPLGGRVHEALAKAIGQTLLESLTVWCEFYLSTTAEFHGVDYRALSNPPGPCNKIEVQGSGGLQIHLPADCTAEIQRDAADRFGRSTERITLRGDFGTTSVSFYPQWAVLGPYHGLSLRFARDRLRTPIKNIHDHDPVKRPSLWVIEVPVGIEVSVHNWAKPWFFLSRRFQTTTAWICDLLDSMEENLSWEWFVDRESLRQTVKEELERAQRSIP